MQIKKSGFTLIELLVVILVVTVLLGLCLGVFTRVREQGRQASCLSNEHQILEALSLYLQDSSEQFPHDNFPPVWTDSLWPYTKSAEVFRCPSDGETDFNSTIGQPTPLNGIAYPKFHSSYIANSQLVHGFPLAEIQHPATTIFVTDGVTQISDTAPFVTPSSPRPSEPGIIVCIYLNDPSYAHEQNDGGCGPQLRHSGLSNVGFVDGHVKAMKPAQWYYLQTPYLNPLQGGR